MWRGAARSAPVRGRLLSVAPVFARSYRCVLIFASDIGRLVDVVTGRVPRSLNVAMRPTAAPFPRNPVARRDRTGSSRADRFRPDPRTSPACWTLLERHEPPLRRTRPLSEARPNQSGFQLVCESDV